MQTDIFNDFFRKNLSMIELCNLKHTFLSLNFDENMTSLFIHSIVNTSKLLHLCTDIEQQKFYNAYIKYILNDKTKNLNLQTHLMIFPIEFYNTLLKKSNLINYFKEIPAPKYNQYNNLQHLFISSFDFSATSFCDSTNQTACRNKIIHIINENQKIILKKTKINHFFIDEIKDFSSIVLNKDSYPLLFLVFDFDSIPQNQHKYLASSVLKFVHLSNFQPLNLKLDPYEAFNISQSSVFFNSHFIQERVFKTFVDMPEHFFIKTQEQLADLLKSNPEYSQYFNNINATRLKNKLNLSLPTNTLNENKIKI